jgi:hypothetical protein
MKEETYLAPRRYHRGMARQCSCGHDGTKPGEDADDMSARHNMHQHQISSRERPSSSRRSSRSPWPKPRCGKRRGRGHREAIGKISWTGRCTIARSTERTPSRRLALAGAVGIERGGGNGDSVARARERGRRGERADWPGRGRPSHLVGLDQVG